MLTNATLSDFRGEQGAKAVPPETDSLVADIDPSFKQQVFNDAKRWWKSDIHHHRELVDLRRCLEVA